MIRLLSFLLFFPLGAVFGQTFTPVTDSPVTTTPSDSRSANFLDLNGDLRDDIFITNGPSTGQNNMLYLNEADGFRSVTDDPITLEMGRSDGATFGDVDNDGDLDAYVVNWYGQRNFFYRNNGDGTFSYEAATADGSFSYSETAAFGDYDRDGWLDLYVTNSTNFTTNTSSVKRNQFFRNRGDGNYDRITEGEPAADANISRSVQWIDYDGDGDTDLWVSNEEYQPNYLYENNGNVFTKRTDLGLNDGDNRSSTGSSWADVDNDGDFDLFVANFNGQKNQLYRNDGTGGFTEDTDNGLALDGGCSFGSGFADFDNDGDLDLFVANGFCGSQTRNFLYVNDGTGNFTRDVSSIVNLPTACSYGAAWGDMNDDGYLDLLVARCKGSASTQPNNLLYRNNGEGLHFARFALTGSLSNRSAVGAIIRVLATVNGTPVWQTRLVETQSGYCGQNSMTQHFGLGDATVMDSVIIEWPSGQREVFTNLTVDQVHGIEESNLSGLGETTFLDRQFRIFPNPADSQLRLVLLGNSEREEDLQLEISAADGRKLKIIPLNAAEMDISVADLRPGIYFAFLRRGSRVSRASRFVVAR